MTDEQHDTEAALLDHQQEIANLLARVKDAPRLVAFLSEVARRGHRATFEELTQFTAVLEATLAKALLLREEDQALPEDEHINAAHPLLTGDYELHADAVRMVGAKRSKNALVDLVNWLLARAVESERQALQRQAIMRRADRDRAGAEQRAANLEAEAHRWSERFFEKCKESALLATRVESMAAVITKWLNGGGSSNLVELSELEVRRARDCFEASAAPATAPTADVMRAALEELELHHVALNAASGRHEAESRTLFIVRAALGKPQAPGPSE